MVFLNSWGETYGDNGLFRFQNHDVLKCYQYIDVFYTEADLTREERDAYAHQKCTLLTEIMKSQEMINQLRDYDISCPSCNQRSRASEFQGNCYHCICPRCYNSFEPTICNLAQYLYLRDNGY